MWDKKVIIYGQMEMMWTILKCHWVVCLKWVSKPIKNKDAYINISGDTQYWFWTEMVNVTDLD
jgi:hypothetical protein